MDHGAAEIMTSAPNAGCRRWSFSSRKRKRPKSEGRVGGQGPKCESVWVWCPRFSVSGGGDSPTGRVRGRRAEVRLPGPTSAYQRLPGPTDDLLGTYRGPTGQS